MNQESIENIFAKYVSEGKWDEKDVPKKIKSNVNKKVKKIKEDKVKKIKEDKESKEEKIKGGE